MVSSNGEGIEHAGLDAEPSSRVSDGYLLTTLEFAVQEQVTWPAHRHREHELLWCKSGLASLEADGRVWAIPPTLAVWIPAGVEHTAGAAAGSTVRATYFVGNASSLVAMPSVVTGLAMTEAARALLLHNLRRDLDAEARLRLQRVVLDLLVPVPHESFDLRMPRPPHLRTIALAVVADPADQRTTEDWARWCGIDQRTLARQFVAETGSTFTQWRIMARMQCALRELAVGEPVLAVARHVGYRSPSAFLAHFRDFTGQTPTEYMDRALTSSASAQNS